MLADFSVLMSLYVKEKPAYLRECMESILRQTVLPREIVVVKDGPLTEELEAVLAEYVARDPDLYTIVPLETNRGLGLALAEGIQHCRYELVARMDTDDVCREDRFALQLALLDEACREERGDIKQIVAQIIPTYVPKIQE